MGIIDWTVIMGRQTLVAMTEVDEARFLKFVRELANVEILVQSAATQEDLVVSEFKPRQTGHWSYHIWNKEFPWTKEYGHIRGDIPDIERRGWIYIKNKGTAPLIEYTRHNFNDTKGHAFGRVYWSTHFTVGKGQEPYDFEAFSKWYDQVVRWIRKNGKQKVKGAYEPYFLPDALKQ